MGFYTKDDKFKFTLEDIELLISAIKKASGGVPKTDAPKKVWDKLVYHKTVLKKHRDPKKVTKVIARIVFMPDRPAKKNEQEFLQGNSITYRIIASENAPEPSGEPESCPEYYLCQIKYGDCIRQDNKCPDAITEKELETILNEEKKKKDGLEALIKKILRGGK